MWSLTASFIINGNHFPQNLQSTGHLLPRQCHVYQCILIANVTEMGYTTLATGNCNIFSKVHNFKRYIFILWSMCVPDCICTCIPVYEGALRGQKRMSPPLELSVTVSVNCLMWVLETKPMSFARMYVPLTTEPTLQPILIIYVCTCVHTCLSTCANVCTTRPVDTYGNWRTLCESLFFSSTIWRQEATRLDNIILPAKCSQRSKIVLFASYWGGFVGLGFILTMSGIRNLIFQLNHLLCRTHRRHRTQTHACTYNKK